MTVFIPTQCGFDVELTTVIGCDPSAGELVWLPRPRELFRSEVCWAGFKTRFEGKSALIATNNQGYRWGTIFDKNYRAHRVLWAIVHGDWPSGHIDHINGNRSDNRIINLRDISREENCRNAKRYRNNGSGVQGVGWCKQSGKWRARIRVGGKQISLGKFESLEDAAAVRKVAERRYGYHPNHGRS